MRGVCRAAAILYLLVLSLLPSANGQQCEIGAAPFYGPVISFKQDELTLLAAYHMWYPFKVNEASNNVPVEGGFKILTTLSPAFLGNRWIQPFVGFEYRNRFERPGNESVLFNAIYEGTIGETRVFPPKSGSRHTGESDPNSSFEHPGFYNGNTARGEYHHLGPVAGVKVRIGSLVYLAASVSYLPVFARDTIEEQYGGSYYYADRGKPLFADITMTVDILGSNR